MEIWNCWQDDLRRLWIIEKFEKSFAVTINYYKRAINELE